jgi:hypothetical protein
MNLDSPQIGETHAGREIVEIALTPSPDVKGSACVGYLELPAFTGNRRQHFSEKGRMCFQGYSTE